MDVKERFRFDTTTNRNAPSKDLKTNKHKAEVLKAEGLIYNFNGIIRRRLINGQKLSSASQPTFKK